MIGRLALILFVGCGSSTLAIRMGDPLAINVHDDTVVLGRCAPTKRIVVADATGAPVVGALVVVRQQEHTNCPSVGPASPLYTTDPIRTDSHGAATICNPETFFPDDQSSVCPHHRDPATVVAVANDRAAQFAAPFAPELHMVMAPCSELLSRDPTFTACKIEVKP
jgi:hypothetical protein